MKGTKDAVTDEFLYDMFYMNILQPGRYFHVLLENGFATANELYIISMCIFDLSVN